MIVPELEDDPEWIELGQQYQVFRPEEGPLERRIQTSFEEALFLKEDEEGFANQEHQDYWFTTPEGGWNQENVRIRAAETLPGEWPNAQHWGEDGEERMPLDQLKEGQVMKGVVTRHMLLHGAQVDIGANFDALIPIDTKAWTTLNWEALSYDSMEVMPPGWVNPFPVGAEVTIRIAQIFTGPLLYFCRFPVVAELLSPQLNTEMPDPYKYKPVFDLRGQGSQLDHLNNITGRHDYEPGINLLDVWPNKEQRFLDRYQLEEEEKYEMDFDGDACLSRETQYAFEGIIASM